MFLNNQGKYFIRLISCLVFFSLVFIYACAGSKKTVNEHSDYPGENTDSLVASLERTRCFGICPYYKFNIYRSGYVLYEGYDNVKNTGRYYTWLSNEKLASIGKKAEASGFFDLNDEYRNPHLTDFPTVYIEVRYHGKKKRITHYDSEPPPNLVEMEKFLDALFNEDTNWMLHPVQEIKE